MNGKKLFSSGEQNKQFECEQNLEDTKLGNIKRDSQARHGGASL